MTDDINFGLQKRSQMTSSLKSLYYATRKNNMVKAKIQQSAVFFGKGISVLKPCGLFIVVHEILGNTVLKLRGIYNV